jgi:hypothetical protein
MSAWSRTAGSESRPIQFSACTVLPAPSAAAAATGSSRWAASATPKTARQTGSSTRAARIQVQGQAGATPGACAEARAEAQTIAITPIVPAARAARLSARCAA